MIQRCRNGFPIRLMCRCLRVSASGYYSWAARPPSARTTENARLVRRMRELHTEHDGVLGSPRMWEELRYAGEQCGRHRVARLMHLHGITPLKRRPYHPVTTQRQPGAVPAPNLLEQDFSTGAPNQKWVSDFTYIETDEGWLYLAVV